MPLTLFRLSCGIIYTEAFIDWLARTHEQQVGAQPHRVLTLDYIRCASGPQRGQAWWQVHWVPEDAAPRHRVFRIGNIPVHIPKSVQLGLRERCLDIDNGCVVVRP